MDNKLLPLGSVVKIKDRDKMISIIGYFHTEKEGKSLKFSQYTGMDYVEGIIEDCEIIYFDEDDIEDVWFMGYMNVGTKALLTVLYEMYKEISAGNQTFMEVFDKIGEKYFKDNKKEFEKIKEKYFGIDVNNDGGE